MAYDQEQLDKVIELACDTGRIWMHPETWAHMQQACSVIAKTLEMLQVTVETRDYIPRNEIFAVELTQLDLTGDFNIEFRPVEPVEEESAPGRGEKPDSQ